MARRGRKVNWDAKVGTLVGELRTAVVERERSRLEERVEAMVAGIAEGVEAAGRKVRGAVARAARKAKGVKGRAVSPGRARQIAATKAYWAAKRKGKGAPRKGAVAQARRARPAGRPKRSSAWAAMTSEQRAARIAKMQAGRRPALGAASHE